MMEVKQLLLVPPGLTGIEPGVHRVIAKAPPLKLVALARLAASGADHDGRVPLKQLLKPIVTSSELLQCYIDKTAIGVIPEATASAPTNKFKGIQRTSQKYLDRQAILQTLIDPDVLFRMLFAGHWAREVERAASVNNVSRHTVLRLLQRYFLLSMDMDLACMYAQRASGRPRKVASKLGRRSLPMKAGKPQSVACPRS